MELKEKVEKLFSNYSYENYNRKNALRTIYEYDKAICEAQIKTMQGCRVNTTTKTDSWLIINKKSQKYYNEFLKIYQKSKTKSDFQLLWGHSMLSWKVGDKIIFHPLFITPIEINFDSINSDLLFKPSYKTYMDIELFNEMDSVSKDEILKLKLKFDNECIDPRKIENVEDYIYKLLCIIDRNSIKHIEIQNSILHMKNILLSDINNLEYPVVYDVPVLLFENNHKDSLEKNIALVMDDINKGLPLPKTIETLIDDSLQKGNYIETIENNEPYNKYKMIISKGLDFLSDNNRVLIAKSLTNKEALNDLMPEEIKPLCFDILDVDNNFEGKIRRKVISIGKKIKKPCEYEESIEELQNQLNECKSRQVNLKQVIDRRRNEENEKVIEIEGWVRDNEIKYGYINDEISENQNQPITEDEMNRLLLLLSRTNKNDMYRINETKIIIDKLPSSNEICSDIAEFKEHGMKYKEYKNSLKDWHISNKRKCDIHNILPILEDARCKLRSIEGTYLEKVMSEYISNRLVEDNIKKLSMFYHKTIINIIAITKELSSHEIEVSIDNDWNEFQNELDYIYDELCDKDNIGKLFKITHRKSLKIIDKCRIDGKTIKTFEQVMLLILYIQRVEMVKEIADYWNDIMQSYSNCKIDYSYEEIIKLKSTVDLIDTIINWDELYDNKILALLRDFDIPEGLNLHNSIGVDYLIERINNIKFIDRYEELKAYICVLKKIISQYKSLNELYEGVERLDEERIKAFYIDAQRLKNIAPRVEEIDNLIKKIEVLCPNFTRKLLQEDRNIIISKYTKWNTAWKWSQWKSRIDKISKVDINKLKIEIDKEKQIEEDIKTDMKLQKVLYYAALRMRNTNNAQKISLWYVPIDKIVECAKRIDDMFDVIIVNMEDKCEAYTLCAMFKAKKAVIIGGVENTIFCDISKTVTFKERAIL